METILFLVFGIFAVIAGIAVITFKNPIYSALALIVTFFSQAGLFILLGAYFVAAVQIIVYAGAIMVLFLFVIMLLNLGSIDVARPAVGTAKVLAIVLGLMFAAEGIYIAWSVSSGTAVARAAEGTGTTITQAQLDAIKEIEEKYQLDRPAINQDYVEKRYNKTNVKMLNESEASELIKTLHRENMGKTYQIGLVLFSKFLLPFEVTSLILLAALIGVIVLVKRENPKPVN